jgi:hypothetical protein
MNKKAIKELVNQYRLTELAKAEAAKQVRELDKALENIEETLFDLAGLPKPKDKEGKKALIPDGQAVERDIQGVVKVIMSRKDNDVSAHTRSVFKLTLV